jgi:hypothetical protein
MSRSGRAGRKEFERSALPRNERTEKDAPFSGTACEEAVGTPSEREGTITTLMDTVRMEAPTRSPVQPAAPLDPPRDTASVSGS